MQPSEHKSIGDGSSRHLQERRYPPIENTVMRHQEQQPAVNVIHHHDACHQGYDNGSSDNTGIRAASATEAVGASHQSTHGSAHPVESFELEGNHHDSADNNTINSGGTSWTLRIPWLRRKRHRRIQQDDEASSIQSHQSRSIISHIGMNGRSSSSSRRRDLDTSNINTDAEAVYYGGVMRTTSPSSVYEEANDAVDGLHHQQHPHLMEQHPSNALPAPLDSLPHHNHPNHRGYKDGTTQTPTAGNSNTKNNSRKGRRYSMLSSFGLEPRNNNRVFRNRSWISTSSNGSTGPKGGVRSKQQKNGTRNGEILVGTSDEDSLADFDEAEWTPQDSSYGAAIPICGWVPKRIRQIIEATLIALTVFALVYMVVTTSMQIQENKQNGNHHSYYNGSSAYNVDANKFDDDWYVEFSQYTNDEDDYFQSDNSNNNGAAGGNNGGG